jgi:hypothetical protein
MLHRTIAPGPSKRRQQFIGRFVDGEALGYCPIAI